MSPSDQIETPARILEVLAHGGYRAELANGHICIARPPAGKISPVAVGDTVQLSFHPSDFSRARILPRDG